MSSMETIQKRLTDTFVSGEFGGFWPAGDFSVEAGLKDDFPYVKEGDALAFPDIVNNAQDRSKWQSTAHLARLYWLAKAWYLMAADGEEKRHVYDAILMPLLDHWLKNDFQSTNWWYNEICIPMQFGEIGIFLFDTLDESRRAKYLEIFGRGSFGTRPSLMKNWTGANLLWFSMVTMYYAVLTGDEALLKLAVSRASEEIVFGREGMQEDGSFFQHGPRLYTCGYGLNFIYTLSKQIFILSGTEFQFSQEKLNLLLFPLLDGAQYMFQGNTVDYCTIGREYTRAGNHTCKNYNIIDALSLLSRVPEMPRQDEIQAFFEAFKNNRSAVTGVRVFEKAMFITSHIDGTYISVRGMNPSLWDEEICNNEGILGYNLSYGTHTTVMKDGGEYFDIAPLWDYARMPGTTARYETDEELLAKPDFTKRAVSGKAFGCGKLDDCGYIVMDFERESITGKFAAMATPFGTVLFGRDFIDSEGEALFTTAEQCRVCGDVSLAEDSKSCVHNGVLYELLVGEKLAYTIEEKRGTYKRNNKSEKEVEFVGDVLTLSLTRADNAYAYVICPEKYKGLFTVSAFSEEKATAKLPDGREMTVSFLDGSCHF